MFSSRKFICKTWILIIYMYCFTKYPFSIAMNTVGFTASQRLVRQLENTTLTLVCHPPSTYTWAAILHDDRVLVNSSESSSNISHTFRRLSCNDFGQYFCVANTTQQINVSVIGCPPQLCLAQEKLLTADLGENVTFDVCVMAPSAETGLPLKAYYNNTWLDNGQCVSRLCATWTHVTMYRYNVNITISKVSEEDYGEMNFKFGSSYSYENNNINYRPMLVPRVDCSTCPKLTTQESTCFKDMYENISLDGAIQNCSNMDILIQQNRLEAINSCVIKSLEGVESLFVLLQDKKCDIDNSSFRVCGANKALKHTAVVCQSQSHSHSATLISHLFMYAGITVGLATIVLVSCCLFVMLSRTRRRGQPKQHQKPDVVAPASDVVAPASDGTETENRCLSQHIYWEVDDPNDPVGRKN